jgi:1,2-phenylacetyl-CoA epoxidase catalytic subunit
MVVDILELPPRLHEALVAWQRRHFTEYPYLLEHWSRFYRQAPFRLTAKLGGLKSETIEVGRNAGRDKFDRVAQMDDEMRAQARRIIRTQASTELGSIQQHRTSLMKAQDEKAQFDVLRIMAEEFRHGYQMIYLLAADDWGGEDVAMQAIDELLEMRTGTHVLDAFNVYFDSFVDNIVFAAVIDRVGKYQLQMQQVFAYAPMARSMAPMLSEEAFHLATGVGTLKQWVTDAALDRGNVSIDAIQRHLNKWIPRGLEMFGDERGGRANVELGLKSMANGEAAAKYHDEVRAEVVDALNAAILRARLPDLPPEHVRSIVARVQAGETYEGIWRGMLLSIPDRRFFRRRGEHAFAMVAPDGSACADLENYVRCLRRSLPDAYVSGPNFGKFVADLRTQQSGGPVEDRDLPFYG